LQDLPAVNHYERLKVSQDAPAEVIRAAYRTLAGKLHPDRQGPDTGPLDATHAQMAALNAAYEVLIDPKLRRDYDATLAPARAESPPPGADQEARQGPPSRVDLDWMTPGSNSGTKPLWPPSQPMVILGISLLAGVLLGLGWFVWQMVGQHQMEQALSDQFAAQPVADQRAAQDRLRAPPELDAQRAAASTTPAPDDQVAAAPARKPTVDELSRMSDEELVKALPALDAPDTPAAPPAGKRRAPAHHPLDGTPLSLRNDMQLVDPLAPEPAGKRH
jgi:curved DNA-binding protein CbpA